MSEYTFVQEYRPKLTVNYGATEYGTHLFPNAVSATQAGNFSRIADDKFKLIRYLDEVDVGWLPTFCNYAQNNGMKVFIHSSIGGVGASNNSTSQDYANHLSDLLTDGNSYVQNGTIIGIEIGGEEEGKRKWWAPGFVPPINEELWFGNQVQGASFANYYLAGREVIKNNSTWKKLQIWSGGSAEKHESVAYLISSASNYGNAGEFLKGFIDRVTYVALQDNKGKYDYLPDAIGIHSYAGKHSPEYFLYPKIGNIDDSNGKQQTLWQDRIEELFDLCNEKGYIPNFVTTEYGFSPVADWRNKWAPDNACEKSQTIYYLRSCLINSTVQPHKGIGWSFSNYFSHNGGIVIDATTCQDFGFHNDPGGNMWGTERAIKYIARALFAPTVVPPNPAFKLNDPDTTTWIGLQGSRYDNIEDTEGYMWCGWETKVNDTTRQKWGAIWRYKQTINTWYELLSNPPESRAFVVPGDVQSTMSVTGLYQFSISAGSASLSDITVNVSEDLVSGNTHFNIPDVTANPILIKFN